MAMPETLLCCRIMTWVLRVKDWVVSLLLTGWLRLRLIDDIDDSVFALQQLQDAFWIVLSHLSLLDEGRKERDEGTTFLRHGELRLSCWFFSFSSWVFSESILA